MTPGLPYTRPLIKAKHGNVVRFLGYYASTHGELMEFNGSCVMAEVRKRLLCFEYVRNGSLHRYLKEKSHGDEWQIRYQIIKGICRGLHYLHDLRINHLDLKPGNILLDVHMEPKIADFGLSRCFDEGQARIFTKKIHGTRGYIAPEIINGGEISFKSDIYPLGIIIIKLLTVA
jgi:serine/threonine protein kinase